MIDEKEHLVGLCEKFQVDIQYEGMWVCSVNDIADSMRGGH